MRRSVTQFFDFYSFLRFLILFLAFYGFDLFWIGSTSPGGKTYSPFLQHWLNYPAWIKDSVLSVSTLFAQWIGVPAYRADAFTINIVHGKGVVMGYSCYGLELMDLWLAFMIADGMTKRKLWWCIGGLGAICLINVLRITLLLFSQSHKWHINSPIDHHTLFNFLGYLLIGLLIYFFHKRNSSRKTTGAEQAIS
jgi:exosortase/archaeosortase family protein